MVHYRRNLHPGGTYFLTVTLRDRRSRLLVDAINHFRAAIAHEKSRHPFGIDAIVVLPDHWHAIMTLPDGDSDYPGRIRRIKAGFTRRLQTNGVLVPRTVSGEASLWQRRYWEHTIRNEEDLRRHVDYIHYNPVKHNHASAPIEWPHSSLHRYIARGWIPADWGNSHTDTRGRFGE